ncbi:lysozyme [Acinetobacter baumannii]|uniref:Lysozyme n=1 Tax=Acinetobacter baumannii TaxID=470 RepID=A0AB73FC61_ACIBA|nr:lysozyme [Acinetobacter baumannii]
MPLTQNQFDALVSLAYNIGSGAFKGSTLLKLLNKGDYKGAADQFLVWNKAGGKVMKGLVRRREAERALFLKK